MGVEGVNDIQFIPCFIHHDTRRSSDDNCRGRPQTERSERCGIVFLGRCKTYRAICFIVIFWCRNESSNGGNVRHTVETMTIITNAAVSLKCRRVSSAFRMWSEVTSKKNSTIYSEFEPIYDRGIVASSRLVTSFLSFTAGLLQVWLGEKWIPCVKNQTGTVDYYLTGSLSG